MIQQLWMNLAEYHAIIVSSLIALVGALISALLRAKVKLIWGQANNSYHLLKNDSSQHGVYCEKHYLQNMGRKPALNVEFVYHHAPTEISIWQARDYTKKPTPEGQFMITIPQIAPKELVIIDSIYINLMTAEVISVKNSEAIGKRVNFIVNRNFGNLFNALMLALFFGGLVFFLNLIVRLFI